MISGIAINPDDPNEVWVCYDSFRAAGSNPAIGDDRVWHKDPTNGWHDISVGVSEVPSADILYQKGSDNRLYLATDIGVYYTDKNLNYEWSCLSDGLPVDECTDLEINYCQSVLRVSTYNRGVWERDLLQPDNFTYGSQMITRIEIDDDAIDNQGNLILYITESTPNIFEIDSETIDVHGSIVVTVVKRL